MIFANFIIFILKLHILKTSVIEQQIINFFGSIEKEVISWKKIIELAKLLNCQEISGDNIIYESRANPDRFPVEWNRNFIDISTAILLEICNK